MIWDVESKGEKYLVHISWENTGVPALRYETNETSKQRKLPQRGDVFKE